MKFTVSYIASKTLSIVHGGLAHSQSIKDELIEFKAMCESMSPSTNTHYDCLDEWTVPVYAFIRRHLHKHGFVNGRPDINHKNTAVQVWLSLYNLPNSVIHSPHLKTDVTPIKSSAAERNEALIKTLDEILNHWEKGDEKAICA